MACPDLPFRARSSGVDRDDLPQPVRPGPWRPPQGAHRAPADPAHHAAPAPGHWEGDLLAGSANTHIATLVERQSRYVLLVKVDAKDTTTVVDALTAQVQ